MDDILAYDRAGSVRFHDADTGRLHVDETPISKAGVNSYRGREIPNHAALRLDPNGLYNMLRPPEELERAASSFNRIPVMAGHPDKAFKAQDHAAYKAIVTGATGSNTRYDHPYLKTDMAVWDKKDIDGIAMDQARELSSCYNYDPDMTPGTYEGAAYDGRMTNIRGHHVALVPLGRAGRDVLVADSGEDALTDIQNGGGQTPAPKADPVTAMDAAAVQAAINTALEPLKAENADMKAELAAADQRQAEAVKAAMDEAKQHMHDLAQAHKDVKPLVGEVVGAAMDSAEAVLDYALKQKNIPAEGINIAGKRALVKMAAERANAPAPRPAAMDADSKKSMEEKYSNGFLA